MTTTRRRPPTALRRAAIAAVLAAAVLVPAGTASAASQTTPASTAPAWVRAAHLVPDLPQMDIDLSPRAGGQAATVDGAGYGDVSKYQQVAPGAYDVKVLAAGSSAGAAPVLTSTLQADAGRAYTVVALGTAADARVVPLEDDLTPPAAGQARVRVLSAASSASAIGVAAVSGPVVAQSAPFASSTTYADVPAGRWTLRATPAPGATGGATAGSTDVVLDAGSTYTLAVTDGRAGSSALVVTPVADARGTTGGVLPAGGAATGGGGAADAVSGAESPWSGASGAFVALALALAGGAAVVVRRRSPARS